MPKADTEKFRLRRFVEKLDEMGEVDTYSDHIELSDLSSIIEKSDKALLFSDVGPENHSLVANVNGSRKRLAAAMDVAETDVIAEFQRRLDNPQPAIEIEKGNAPVQDIVLTGDQADLTKLPFHIQHQFDGGVYLSSGIDYSVNPETGVTNVGCRRLSLRGPQEAGTNLTAPSDLKEIYLACVERGEKLTVNFAAGSHPVDYLAAGMRIPTDELALVGTLRGEPLPLVKAVTNDGRIPADAELIIEGYLDEKGHVEPEGPYGEFVGYYGPMHMDPVYHVTAITMRQDALHQTLLHGSGYDNQLVESVHLMAVRIEAQTDRILKATGIEVVDIHLPPASAEGQALRVAIRQRQNGDARTAISALFAEVFSAKHIFITDEDIDIRSEHQMEWALASRFQAERDTVILKNMAGMPLNPSLNGGGVGDKAGFDLTLPLESRGRLTMRPAGAPVINGDARYQTVRQTLQEASPLFFAEIMQAVGSRDGREVSVQLTELRQDGILMRNSDGQYLLGKSEKGRTGLTDPVHH